MRKSYRVSFIGGTGFELAGIVDRPDDHSADSPVCVFSHCFTCNKDLKAIVRISRGLSERGVAVLRYDMTGLGGSRGDFSQTNFTTNVADLHAAIRFADQEIGRVTALLGHSFGGAASLAVAGKMGEDENQSNTNLDDLQAVIALAAPSETQHLAYLLAKMDPQIESTGIGSVNIGGRDWAIHRQMLEDFQQHDLPERIAKVKAATLLLHSPVDATVGFDHALRIMGLIHNAADGGAPVSLISLEGADHLLVDVPADLELVTEACAGFLNRYAQPR